MPYIIRKLKDLKPREISCGQMRDLTTSKDFEGADVVHVTIDESTKEHYHKKLTEFYYVIKGSIAVEIDGKTKNLNEGSIIMISPNTKHKAWKTSEKAAEILVVCCPPWTEEDEVLV